MIKSSKIEAINGLSQKMPKTGKLQSLALLIIFYTILC